MFTSLALLTDVFLDLPAVCFLFSALCSLLSCSVTLSGGPVYLFSVVCCLPSAVCHPLTAVYRLLPNSKLKYHAYWTGVGNSNKQPSIIRLPVGLLSWKTKSYISSLGASVLPYEI
jgi:hypothetical protein